VAFAVGFAEEVVDEVLEAAGRATAPVTARARTPVRTLLKNMVIEDRWRMKVEEMLPWIVGRGQSELSASRELR